MFSKVSNAVAIIIAASLVAGAPAHAELWSKAECKRKGEWLMQEATRLKTAEADLATQLRNPRSDLDAMREVKAQLDVAGAYMVRLYRDHEVNCP
jgi:hypothetical protein